MNKCAVKYCLPFCAGYAESLINAANFLGAVGPHVTIHAEDFQQAYLAYRRIAVNLHSLESLGVKPDISSPLNVCPICSPRPDAGTFVLLSIFNKTTTNQPHNSRARSTENYDVSLSMDVVNKVSHMAHAGNDINLKPHLNCFFDKGEKRKKMCVDLQ
jgi:hypothetical protein